MKEDNTNKSFWERFAKIYTKFMSKNKHTYEKISLHLCGYIDENKKVLELACGTGQITFLSAGNSALWEATDYSEKMVLEAKKRNDENYKIKQINFNVQDATQLQYKDNSFDVVVIANALHIMPEPDRALAEIQRVLKENGILFAPTFVYEIGYSRFFIGLMEKAGFKTFHKWTREEYENYVANKGFLIKKSLLEKGKPLPECVLIATKE